MALGNNSGSFVRKSDRVQQERERERMVARKFEVRHNDAEFVVDYDTDDGLEVCLSQNGAFSL